MATSYEQYYKQALAQQQKAIQPALSAYQALIPITQQTYAQKATALESQRPLLQERYQNLLGEINRKQTQETGQVSQDLSREYGKRGIPLSSGVFSQGLQEKLSPIQQFYTGQTKDVGLAQREDLNTLLNQQSALPIEKQGALQNIQNQIAQLRSGVPGAASSLALQLYQTELQRQQANQPDPLQHFLAQYQQQYAQLEKSLKQKYTPVKPISSAASTSPKLADVNSFFGGVYNPATGQGVGGSTPKITPQAEINPYALSLAGKKVKSPFGKIGGLSINAGGYIQ